MHISVGAVSHHILFLEAIQAAVVGSEFQVITSPSKGLLAPNVAPALALSRFRSANPFDKLSPRELTVCDLVIEGSRAPEIAQQLAVSAKTINTYRYRILEKLGIDSDVELHT